MVKNFVPENEKHCHNDRFADFDTYIHVCIYNLRLLLRWINLCGHFACPGFVGVALRVCRQENRVRCENQVGLSTIFRLIRNCHV